MDNINVIMNINGNIILNIYSYHIIANIHISISNIICLPLLVPPRCCPPPVATIANRRRHFHRRRHCPPQLLLRLPLPSFMPSLEFIRACGHCLLEQFRATHCTQPELAACPGGVRFCSVLHTRRDQAHAHRVLGSLFKAPVIAGAEC